jgi:3-dehydroquinate dehydratase-2
LILNGPNLNLLGTREPEIYGSATLDQIEAECRARAADRGLVVECRQSNSEGELVDWIQEARGNFDALVLNPGAYTHTSIAILDALLAFRGQSYVSKAALGTIAGFGKAGYVMALDALAERLIEVDEA